MLNEFWLSLEYLPLAMEIGATWWFPLLESLHVISITLLVGSILMVDLRLLGVAALSYAVSKMVRELVPWTLLAFIVAVITGLGLFITRASAHMANPAFQWKLGLLALAGLNMAFFHFRSYRQVSLWDGSSTIPWQARLAGAMSLLLWSAVMLSGRWVGHII
ncbi:MAG: DUF6644 family protein [Pseudomonadales bacterium]|nr:DUF6644 family protein [Pseudomonadales bacterium]